MTDFLRGAVAMAAVTVALFFLRYYRGTRERLFLLFALAFALFALNWGLPVLGGSLAAQAHAFRFLAFLLIAVAVLDKNRRDR